MLGGDPVCLHRAAYWYAQGVLELDPEPNRLRPPRSSASTVAGQRPAAPSARALALRPSLPKPLRCTTKQIAWPRSRPAQQHNATAAAVRLRPRWQNGSAGILRGMRS